MKTKLKIIVVWIVISLVVVYGHKAFQTMTEKKTSGVEWMEWDPLYENELGVVTPGGDLVESVDNCEVALEPLPEEVAEVGTKKPQSQSDPSTIFEEPSEIGYPEYVDLGVPTITYEELEPMEEVQYVQNPLLKESVLITLITTIGAIINNLILTLRNRKQ